jgi:5-methylcytosine-specific restriction endonuclease McrA
MTNSSWDDIKQAVYDRSNGCCEYCQNCEVNTGQTMQVDHINPSGGDDLDNLALACWNCNNHKRQATEALDPETNQTVPLFHPRQQSWADHFLWTNNSIRIVGRTPIGRATIVRLKMNRPTLMQARKRWVEGGHHPPGTE